MYFDDYKISEKSLYDGVQKIYRFPNGYGASVIRHSTSYGGRSGLWELAVIEFDGDYWHITYDTPITDDVVGYLDDYGVTDTLSQIAKFWSN